MKKISQLFLQGLLAILPIVVTAYIIYWLGNLAETVLGKIIQFFLPTQWYIPGMGILAGFALILVVGILLKAYIFRQLAGLFEQLLERIPLIKTIYTSVRDIARFASKEKKDDLEKTVLVTLDNDLKVMGFVTRRDLTLGKQNDLIAVYVPMSYQIGGFTLMVNSSKIEAIDVDAQTAMRFIVTAGMTDMEKNSN